MKFKTFFCMFIILCAVILIAGCTQQSPSHITPVPTTNTIHTKALTPETVKVASNNALGKYLTDGQGITLYYYEGDVKGSGISSCTGTCPGIWPPFYSEKIVVNEPLNEADFGVITRADGTKQTTYKGIPLYEYLKDFTEGDVLGQGVNDAWVVANIDGIINSKNSLATTSNVVTPVKGSIVSTSQTYVPVQSTNDDLEFLNTFVESTTVIVPLIDTAANSAIDIPKGSSSARDSYLKLKSSCEKYETLLLGYKVSPKYKSVQEAYTTALDWQIRVCKHMLDAYDFYKGGEKQEGDSEVNLAAEDQITANNYYQQALDTTKNL